MNGHWNSWTKTLPCHDKLWRRITKTHLAKMTTEIKWFLTVFGVVFLYGEALKSLPTSLQPFFNISCNYIFNLVAFSLHSLSLHISFYFHLIHCSWCDTLYFMKWADQFFSPSNLCCLDISFVVKSCAEIDESELQLVSCCDGLNGTNERSGKVRERASE